MSAESMLSQAQYEEMTLRAGLRVLGGNLTQIPRRDAAGADTSDAVAWAGRGLGLFVVDDSRSETLDFDATAQRNVIVCGAVLSEAATDIAIGESRLATTSSDMAVAFVPRGERFRFSTRTRQGFKAVTIMVDLMSVMESLRLPASSLPPSLLRIVRRGEATMDSLSPGAFGSIAARVAARRGLFPPLASLYYEGKALELASALLSQLSCRDAMQAGDGIVDARILARLDEVRRTIDLAPHRALDIDALARLAAMNRTKLRSAFKQAYGTTLSDYRAALLLQRADQWLRQSGATVQKAAHRAGYASASSFIVAYKRRFGVCPGDVVAEARD
ncbi:helix-turn-helix transcriptional regulator [Inquilinus sp.]|jgi:AraC-like DNA-binding protein|uniref:helix-turn-helix transcriptional regulator n=1 Tax=Inquilinus sp. TaxID=1932117 RepID=UPI00378516F1